MDLVGCEDDPEVLDQLHDLLWAELKKVLLEGVEDEVNAGVELIEVTAVAIRAE